MSRNYEAKNADILFLIVASSVVLAGIGLFFTFAETDYHVEFDGQHDTIRRTETATTFENLNQTQKQAFNQTVAGGVETYDGDIDYPAIVQYHDQYYYFSYYSTVEWTNPSTAGFAGMALLGSGAIFVAVRRSMRNWVRY